jgi:hypothetical protein
MYFTNLAISSFLEDPTYLEASVTATSPHCAEGIADGEDAENGEFYTF